jgi:hypothetical protein
MPQEKKYDAAFYAKAGTAGGICASFTHAVVVPVGAWRRARELGGLPNGASR